MVRGIALAAAGVALAFAPAVSPAASLGFNLRAIIPVHCQVQHMPTGFGAISGDAVSLGQFSEYCNAPSGYQLVVNYTPGTLRGARILSGDDQVELNGSGQAVLSRAEGPRIRQRMIAAIPGENGFDTDRLEMRLIPN